MFHGFIVLGYKSIRRSYRDVRRNYMLWFKIKKYKNYKINLLHVYRKYNKIKYRMYNNSRHYKRMTNYWFKRISYVHNIKDKKMVIKSYYSLKNMRFILNQELKTKTKNKKKSSKKSTRLALKWSLLSDKNIKSIYAQKARYKRKQRYKSIDKKQTQRLILKKLNLKHAIYDNIQFSFQKLFNGLVPNPYRYRLNFKRYIFFKFKKFKLHNLYIQFIPQIGFKTVKRGGQKIRTPSKPNIIKSHSLVRRWLKKGCKSRTDRTLKSRIIKEFNQPRMSFRYRLSDINLTLKALAIL